MTPDGSGQGDNWTHFQVSLELMQYHGTLVWHSFTAFLVAHSLLLGFLLNTVKDRVAAAPAALGGPAAVAFVAFAGVVLSLVWLMMTTRMWDYYDIYSERARRAQPPGWNLLVTYEEMRTTASTRRGMTWLGRRMRVRSATRLLVAVFALAYGVLAIIGMSAR